MTRSTFRKYGQDARRNICCIAFFLAIAPQAFSQVAPQVGVMVSEERKYAQRLLQRLSGTLVPIDHPMLTAMEARLKVGDRLGAAKIATGDLSLAPTAGTSTGTGGGHPNFLNLVVKQMALQMSNREESIAGANLNDMTAAFIVFARDERNLKEILTENSFYVADPTKLPTGVSISPVVTNADLISNVIRTNKHYDDLEVNRIDIGRVLTKRDGQLIQTSATTVVANPDASGVLTSRAFLSSHARAGTNRRLVEYSFREFMCVPMAEMADVTAIRSRIGRDVERAPGGDAQKFQTNCAGCHSVMDGFRGAFANIDFFIPDPTKADAYIKHTKVNSKSTATLDANNLFSFSTDLASNVMNRVDTTLGADNIVHKMNHNINYANGFQMTDNSFENFARNPANASLFGWRGSKQDGGNGIRDFGQLLSESKRFSQCMAKRVYEAVCNPGKGYDYGKVKPLLDNYANKFESDPQKPYSLKLLFQMIATDSVCIQ